MADEIYADAIGEITVTGSVVRVDLFTKSVDEKDGRGHLKPKFKQRLIFPIEGFVHAIEAMLQVRQQLLKRGILKLNEDQTSKKHFTEAGKPRRPN